MTNRFQNKSNKSTTNNAEFARTSLTKEILLCKHRRLRGDGIFEVPTTQSIIEYNLNTDRPSHINGIISVQSGRK